MSSKSMTDLGRKIQTMEVIEKDTNIPSTLPTLLVTTSGSAINNITDLDEMESSAGPVDNSKPSTSADKPSATTKVAGWPYNTMLNYERESKKRKRSDSGSTTVLVSVRPRPKSPNPAWFDKTNLPLECKEIYLKLKNSVRIRSRYAAHANAIEKHILDNTVPRSIKLTKQPPLGQTDPSFITIWGAILRETEQKLCLSVQEKCECTTDMHTKIIDQCLWDLGKFCTQGQLQQFKDELEAFEKYFIKEISQGIKNFEEATRGNAAVTPLANPTVITTPAPLNTRGRGTPSSRGITRGGFNRGRGSNQPQRGRGSSRGRGNRGGRNTGGPNYPPAPTSTGPITAESAANIKNMLNNIMLRLNSMDS